MLLSELLSLLAKEGLVLPSTVLRVARFAISQFDVEK
jgi:hypothetical protein